MENTVGSANLSSGDMYYSINVPCWRNANGNGSSSRAKSKKNNNKREEQKNRTDGMALTTCSRVPTRLPSGRSNELEQTLRVHPVVRPSVRRLSDRGNHCRIDEKNIKKIKCKCLQVETRSASDSPILGNCVRAPTCRRRRCDDTEEFPAPKRTCNRRQTRNVTCVRMMDEEGRGNDFSTLVFV